MCVGTGLYIYDVVVKSSRSLSHLLMSSCCWCDCFLQSRTEFYENLKGKIQHRCYSAKHLLRNFILGNDRMNDKCWSVRQFFACLSVCNARAPCSAGWNFRQCFCAIWYLGHPWQPRKFLRRSSQGNLSVGVFKRKRGSQILRFWTYRRLYLWNDSN